MLTRRGLPFQPLCVNRDRSKLALSLSSWRSWRLGGWRLEVLPNDLALDVQHLRRAQVVPERLEILERPDHFLIVRDLDELRIVRPRVGVPDNEVAVRQML